MCSNLLCEIYFMIQQGRLGGGSGHYGYLTPLATRLEYTDTQTHSVLVQEQYLHPSSLSARGAVTHRHHLGDVTRCGLRNIHVEGQRCGQSEIDVHARRARHQSELQV
jgi:hypothetical protein